MKKVERIYYLGIIVIEVILIVFLGNKLAKYKNHLAAYEKEPEIIKAARVDRLYSFWAKNTKGENELIQFTAYSNQFYIFVRFSTECMHCDELIDEMSSFFLNREIDKGITLFLLTLKEEKVYPFPSTLDHTPIKLLKLSFDDAFQFGMEIPSIMAVNGKGDILLKRMGYQSGVFEDLLDAIKKNKYRKSKRIEQ